MANPKKMKAWTRIGETYDGFTHRKAFEEIQQAIDALFDARERTTTPIVPPGSGGGGGSGLVSLPYPFVVDAGSDLYPPGVPVLVGPTGLGLPCKIVYAAMFCDPAAAGPTAATTFKFQNDGTSPTSVGSLTFAPGASSAAGVIALALGASDKLHVIAPASLNGLQDLYAILIRPEPM